MSYQLSNTASRSPRLLHLLACLPIVLILLSGCAQATQAAASPPDYWPTGGWRTSTPEAQGMDSEILAQMYEAIAEQDVNLHSLLVIRNGYIVTEAYFQPYKPYTPHDIASVTKSVTATLVGVAVEQGLIDGIDQPVLGFFPDRSIENRDDRKEALTLENLLTLETGFACDLGTTEAGMYQSGDWVSYLLDLPMAAEPGQEWYYCSPATHLLSAVLETSTGLPTREYANTNLFEPLGIGPVRPAQWPTDPQGITRGDIDLDMTPRDVAKLGLLYLQDGVWDSTRLLPKGWVAAASAQQADKGDGTSYGYLWTTYPGESRYAALGLGGQQLHILPEQNMVVVVTAALPAYAESEDINALLNEYILPAVESNEPLPDNPDAVARLEALQQVAAEPEPMVAPIPGTARAVSGHLYMLEENPMGWQSMRFLFSDDEAVAQAVLNEAIRFAVGLDGRYRVTETPGSLPTALRATWIDDTTIEIEQVNIGSTDDYRLIMTFDGSDIRVHALETVFNTVDVEVHGETQD